MTHPFSPLNIALFGYGRMGKSIHMVAGSGSPYHVQSIKLRGDIANLDGVDVILDFSEPNALEENLKEAIFHNIPILIGVTGLSATHYEALKKASAHIPLCYAESTSLAALVLHILVEKATRFLKDYDASIFEVHHKHKKDAPSGIGLSLMDILQKNKHDGKDDLNIPSCSSMRGGGVTGEHQVHFLGEDDALILTHRSFRRDVFARGALTLASLLVQKKKGFYTPRDLFGMSST